MMVDAKKAIAAMAVMAVAGCEPVPDDRPVITGPEGGPIVVLTDAEIAAVNRPNPALQPMRMRRDGQTYLVQMRNTELPSAPLPPDPDPADDIVTVDDLMLRYRPDVAVSRAARPFTLDDRAEAEAVTLDFCDRMGWTRLPAAQRQAPRFQPVNAPGDSNEWIFPNWCENVAPGDAS